MLINEPSLSIRRFLLSWVLYPCSSPRTMGEVFLHSTGPHILHCLQVAVSVGPWGQYLLPEKVSSSQIFLYFSPLTSTAHSTPHNHGSWYGTFPFIPVILSVPTKSYFRNARYSFRTRGLSTNIGSQIGPTLKHSDPLHIHAVSLRSVLISSFNLLSYMQSESVPPNFIRTYFPHPRLSWPSVLYYN
jgi:hypothetical protein